MASGRSVVDETTGYGIDVEYVASMKATHEQLTSPQERETRLSHISYAFKQRSFALHFSRRVGSTHRDIFDSLLPLSSELIDRTLYHFTQSSSAQ